MYTYYSSFAFVLVSLFTPGSWMQPYLSVLSATSILHHAKFYQNYPGRWIVKLIDRAMAHIVALRALHDATQLVITDTNRMKLYVAYFCLAYVVATYHGRLRYVDDWPLHKSMHVVASIGLWLLYSCEDRNKLAELCHQQCTNIRKNDIVPFNIKM